MKQLADKEIQEGFEALKIANESDRRRLTNFDATKRKASDAMPVPITTTNTFGFELKGAVYAELESDSGQGQGRGKSA